MIFTARFLIGRWSAKDLLQWESAIYHSIKLGFEGPVAKKFLNGIYYIMTLGIIITDNKVHLYWFDVHYVRNCFVHTQKIYIAALTSGSDKSRINTDVYFLIHSSYMPENKWKKWKGWDVNDFFRLKWNKIKLVEDRTG